MAMLVWVMNIVSYVSCSSLSRVKQNKHYDSSFLAKFEIDKLICGIHGTFQSESKHTFVSPHELPYQAGYQLYVLYISDQTQRR